MLNFVDIFSNSGQYSEERRSAKASTRTYGSTSLTTEYTSTAYSSGEARVTTGKSGKDHMAHVQAQILRQPHLERWEAQEQDREQREQREYEERRRYQRQQQLLSQGGCRPAGECGDCGWWYGCWFGLWCGW